MDFNTGNVRRLRIFFNSVPSHLRDFDDGLDHASFRFQPPGEGVDEVSKSRVVRNPWHRVDLSFFDE